MPDAPLSPALFDFLFDLDVHNERAWFDAHRDEYEQHVRAPVLALIGDLADPIHREVSRHLLAVPSIRGGSMFRPHRDVRFSKDKRPYKTHTAFQLRHEQGRDVSAPGVYVHLEPGNVFVAAGMFRPPNPVLNRLRDDIVERPGVFRRMVTMLDRRGGHFGGSDPLVRGPKGYDRDHELIDELCRTSWIRVHELSEDDATAPGFRDTVVACAAASAPLLSWQCRVLGLAW